MEKKIKNKTILGCLFSALPVFVFAQDIDPPPATPIDDSIEVLLVVAILLASYNFYKKNLKTKTK